jgi:hypothetical protein
MPPRKIAIRKLSGSVLSEHPVDQSRFEVCVFPNPVTNASLFRVPDLAPDLSQSSHRIARPHGVNVFIVGALKDPDWHVSYS